MDHHPGAPVTHPVLACADAIGSALKDVADLDPWCEAHHAGVPWAAGGQTDLADGVLLCSWHHHRAHDPRYHTRHPPNGDLTFYRRT